MAGLAEWFAANEIPVKLLDLDTENKARGSLSHFFGGSVPKVNIHAPAGLDSFVDELADGPPVVLADMGAGAGQVTYDWFETMYPDVSDVGIVFTAIGVVTVDPASVESVLAWASRLQNRVESLSSRTASRSTPTSRIGARVTRLCSFKESSSRQSFIWITACPISKMPHVTMASSWAT
jgi:hypothetical protein